MINDKKFPVVFPEENTYYNSKRFTWDHFWILWFLEFTPPTWPKLFRDLSAFFPAREYSVLRPRFPGRTPWPFSCTVPKLAKFYSACYMLHTTEYWLPVQGFFLKKKKKPQNFSTECRAYYILDMAVCVSKPPSLERVPVFWCLLQGTKRAEDATLLWASLRCRGLCIWELWGQLFIFTCYYISIISPVV